MRTQTVEMGKVLEDFGDQIKEGYNLGEKVKVVSKIDSIVVSGMGGSALPGEMLKSYLNKTKIPISIVKEYDIPEYLNSNTLFFSVSYSGNTEETIEAFKAAWRKGCKVVVVASGGRLVDLAKEKKVPVVLIPEGVRPRMAYGYMFFAILRILENSKMVGAQQKEVEKTINLLKKFESFKDKADDFVERLKDKIPLVYTSQSLRAIGYKWKINFNETSKIQAFSNVIPEMNHNEIMAFLDDNKDFFVFFIKDEDEARRINKRIDFTKEIIKKEGIDSAEINLTGGSRLSKIFSAIYIGDWLSYLLARERKISPELETLIDALKKKMKTV